MSENEIKENDNKTNVNNNVINNNGIDNNTNIGTNNENIQIDKEQLRKKKNYEAVKRWREKKKKEKELEKQKEANENENDNELKENENNSEDIKTEPLPNEIKKEKLFTANVNILPESFGKITAFQHANFNIILRKAVPKYYANEPLSKEEIDTIASVNTEIARVFGVNKLMLLFMGMSANLTPHLSRVIIAISHKYETEALLNIAKLKKDYPDVVKDYPDDYIKTHIKEISNEIKELEKKKELEKNKKDLIESLKGNDNAN